MNAPDLGQVTWRKSSRSSGNGQCAEWADLGQAVAMRDSKDPSGPALIFTRSSWLVFIQAVKRGEADL